MRVYNGLRDTKPEMQNGFFSFTVIFWPCSFGRDKQQTHIITIRSKQDFREDFLPFCVCVFSQIIGCNFGVFFLAIIYLNYFIVIFT